MKKTPTDENTIHEPDGALASTGAKSFTVTFKDPERVREYDDTGRMLVAFAATAQHHADRHPDDLEAQGIAAILTAMEHAHRNPDDSDPEAQQFRNKIGKWDVNHPSGLMWHVREYTEKPGRGPRTRRQQANMLCSAVTHGLRCDWDARQIAERFIMVLRTAPDIAEHTRVPFAGAWHGTEEKGDAVLDVEGAIEEILETADAKALVRAALRALGCQDSTVQNLYRT